MHRLKAAALVGALALLLAACGGDDSGGTGGEDKGVTVKLGSNDFTEQLILGQIYKQGLEAAGYTVEYQEGIGSREVIFPALESGQLDMYVEYTGSALQILAKESPPQDPEQAAQALSDFLATKDIATLEMTPLVDQQAFTVTSETAQQHGLTTISDLGSVDQTLTVGGPPECKDRKTCFAGLSKAPPDGVYGLDNLEFKPVSGGLKYTALTEGDTDVAVSFSTEGQIARLDLVILEDDKGMVPPDNAIPIVRQEFLDQAGPEFEEAVNRISAEITTEEMTELIAKVAIDHEDAEDVAQEWLMGKGLI